MALVLLLVFSMILAPASANAQCAGGPGCSGCSVSCAQISSQEKEITKKYITQDFINHREWLVKVVFEQNILPALMLFTEQMTAMAMSQVEGIGMLLDAKHQLETQRLFQTLMAKAHKDYQPSEGMCVFGTNVRSLAASDRNTDLSAMAISNRVVQRELLSGDTLAGGGEATDINSRVKQFIELYCNPADNGNGLKNLCPNPSKDPSRMNNDINYTALIDTPLTLKLDFTQEGDADHGKNKHDQNESADEEDVFALASNLYAHKVAPTFPPGFLTDEKGVVNENGTTQYMDMRAITAKRSVARNSFAEIAALKSQGEKEGAPFLKALMKEFGVDDKEAEKYLGDRPSYYAQMEMLTKKMYQNPTFYTELYDKPVNVERKEVAMQAIELMQRRDIYRSVLRSEAILSVMLETALAEPQDKISNEIPRLTDDGDLIPLP